MYIQYFALYLLYQIKTYIRFMEKSANTITREMSHTMTFLKSMGYDVENLQIETVMTIKREILNTLTTELGEPTNEVENPF